MSGAAKIAIAALRRARPLDPRAPIFTSADVAFEL
jgi:hypothetical protein